MCSRLCIAVGGYQLGGGVEGSDSLGRGEGLFRFGSGYGAVDDLRTGEYV